MNIPALKSLPLSMLENGDHQMVTGLGSILSIKERNIDCIHGICMLMKRMRFSGCITGKKEACKGEHQYELLGKYDSMDELLESRVIGSRPFREVIMDDDTVLLGQD